MCRLPHFLASVGSVGNAFVVECRMSQHRSGSVTPVLSFFNDAEM